MISLRQIHVYWNTSTFCFMTQKGYARDNINQRRRKSSMQEAKGICLVRFNNKFSFAISISSRNDIYLINRTIEFNDRTLNRITSKLFTICTFCSILSNPCPDFMNSIYCLKIGNVLFMVRMFTINCILNNTNEWI